jgi:hypothetical protein
MSSKISGTSKTPLMNLPHPDNLKEESLSKIVANAAALFVYFEQGSVNVDVLSQRLNRHLNRGEIFNDDLKLRVVNIFKSGGVPLALIEQFNGCPRSGPAFLSAKVNPLAKALLEQLPEQNLGGLKGKARIIVKFLVHYALEIGCCC